MGGRPTFSLNYFQGTSHVQHTASVWLIVALQYRKTPKNLDTRKFAVIILKVRQMRRKDAEEIKNSV